MGWTYFVHARMLIHDLWWRHSYKGTFSWSWTNIWNAARKHLHNIGVQKRLFLSLKEDETRGQKGRKKAPELLQHFIPNLPRLPLAKSVCFIRDSWYSKAYKALDEQVKIMVSIKCRAVPYKVIKRHDVYVLSANFPAAAANTWRGKLCPLSACEWFC